MPYTGDKIITSKAVYRPIQYEGIVFGSVATLRTSFMLTEVKHLVVHPAFRKVGLGKSLIDRAMVQVDTPVMYATIRSTNTPSLNLFQNAGFNIVSTAKMKDHETHFLIKNNATHLEDNSNRKTRLPKFKLPSNPLGFSDGVDNKD